MSYSRSGDITQEEYQKLVPKFLKLLSSYGYSQAKIRSPLKFKKGDTITTFSDIIVKEFLEFSHLRINNKTLCSNKFECMSFLDGSIN